MVYAASRKSNWLSAPHSKRRTAVPFVPDRLRLARIGLRTEVPGSEIKAVTVSSRWQGATITPAVQLEARLTHFSTWTLALDQALRRYLSTPLQNTSKSL